MKKTPCPSKPSLKLLCVAACMMAATPYIQAHPYASGITGTNAAGDVSFYMNEDGATVTVTFEDASSVSLGVLAKGSNFFHLGSHTSYSISCYKQGTGSPSIISSDAVGVYTYSNSVWNAPSGVAVNKNPEMGGSFGRLYVANNTAGAQASGPKAVGVYAMNADQSFVAFANAPTGASFVGGSGANFKSPGRLRVAPDNSLLVADSPASGLTNKVHMFTPDLSSSTVLLKGNCVF